MPIGSDSFWKRTHQHHLDLVLQENILTLALFPELFILLNTHWMNYESGSLMTVAKPGWKPYNTYFVIFKGRQGGYAKSRSITRLLTQNIFSFYIRNYHFWILDCMPNVAALKTFSTSDNNVFWVAVWSSYFLICVFLALRTGHPWNPFHL